MGVCALGAHGPAQAFEGARPGAPALCAHRLQATHRACGRRGAGRSRRVAPGSYGAIALVVGDAHTAGSARGYASQAAAEGAAMVACAANGRGAHPCEVRLWFSNGCGALAVSRDGNWGVDNAVTATGAEAGALRACRAQRSHTPCVVQRRVCAP